MAITMPISTNTTIAACSQIHSGDMARNRTRRARAAAARGGARRLLATGVAATALAAAPLTAGTAAHARGAPRARAASSSMLVGVNVAGPSASSQPAEIDRSIAAAHALGSQLVRASVAWAALEPSAGAHVSPSALASVDRLVADAGADGMRVILEVGATPCWASSAPAPLLRSCVPGALSRATAWPPLHPGDYATVVAFLAKRYGNELAAIEVWNEPDQSNELYLAGPHKPERYAALVRAAYPAIKAADPNVLVLAGSLVGSNGRFLKALYAAGIKGYYDALAVHFYDLPLASVRSIREVQLANGDSRPLWLDEFGWSSCYPRRKLEQEQACVTAKLQAQDLRSTFRALAKAPYVAAAVSFQLQDGGGEQFGLLSASGARKPAFAAVAGAFSSLSAPSPPVSLHVRRARGSILASGSGPTGDYMRLEVLRGGALRYWALFTLNRFNGYSLRLPRALGTHGLLVRVYQYWAGVGADAQASI
jgi:Cellulase (glycosyl hydrolase family 5)